MHAFSMRKHLQPGDLLEHYVEIYDAHKTEHNSLESGELQYRSFLAGASLHPIWKLHRGDRLIKCVHACVHAPASVSAYIMHATSASPSDQFKSATKFVAKVYARLLSPSSATPSSNGSRTHASSAHAPPPPPPRSSSLPPNTPIPSPELLSEPPPLSPLSASPLSKTDSVLAATREDGPRPQPASHSPTHLPVGRDFVCVMEVSVDMSALVRVSDDIAHKVLDNLPPNTSECNSRWWCQWWR